MNNQKKESEKASGQGKKTGFRDPLLQVIKYHKDILEYVENFEKIVDLWYGKDSRDKVAKVQNFLERAVIDHYMFEDGIVFPAILTGLHTPEMTRLVAVLQNEHQLILKEIEDFMKTVSDGGFPYDRQTMKKLFTVTSGILEKVQRHAVKEDEQLIPVLKKNRQIFDRYWTR